ncbi:MAG: peptide ABC transporter ATP-binding protein [Pseudonocardiales bacterium]|nr:MAG: peptide ABC transporter ATP-binding protein [Pseudonocardiales bacterium]
MTAAPLDLDISSAPANPPSDAYLSVRDLYVEFPTEDGVVLAVNGINLDLERGGTLGIVGESGSGKSVTSQAILGLLKGTRARVSGSIFLDGRDLVRASESEMRALRGDAMAMIFQDPLSSMHPFYTVGKQITEAYRVHNKVGKAKAKQHTIEMLDRVGIPNPQRRYAEYPHQFSGGMRQRAMIAMALVCNPSLLIADEPTTALDVTVQAQILDLMKDVQKEFNSAIILITHDLGVVAEICNDVLVMYGGQCVEQGTVDELFYRPEMPYAWGLLSSMPRMDRTRQARLQPIPGQPPSLIRLPSGCVFNPRCRYRDRVPGERCTTEHPDLLAASSGHAVRCHIPSAERQEIFANEIKPVL